MIVIIRPDAEADIEAIAVHVAQDSASRALKLSRRLRARVRILATHPEAGRQRPELGEGLRSLTERPYVLIYRLIDETAEVVAILHGARDLRAALAQRVPKT